MPCSANRDTLERSKAFIATGRNRFNERMFPEEVFGKTLLICNCNGGRRFCKAGCNWFGCGLQRM